MAVALIRIRCQINYKGSIMQAFTKKYYLYRSSTKHKRPSQIYTSFKIVEEPPIFF